MGEIGTQVRAIELISFEQCCAVDSTYRLNNMDYSINYLGKDPVNLIPWTGVLQIYQVCLLNSRLVRGWHLLTNSLVVHHGLLVAGLE